VAGCPEAIAPAPWLAQTKRVVRGVARHVGLESLLSDLQLLVSLVQFPELRPGLPALRRAGLVQSLLLERVPFARDVAQKMHAHVWVQALALLEGQLLKAAPLLDGVGDRDHARRFGQHRRHVRG
jgi:hypothetical protein